ncbi:MAG: hypothetical protein H0X03_05695 [Nitrosopumilus sp.]|nr:hypothetical protein [Nitrosopumilus sp.]
MFCISPETIKLTDEDLEKIRKESKLYPKPVPFDKMPKDVSKMLTEEEYRNFIDEKGTIVGLYEAIHGNNRFNEWKNLLIPVFEDEFDVVVYLSGEGWTRRKYKNIKKQLIERFQLCNKYFLGKLIDKVVEEEIYATEDIKTNILKIKKLLSESSEECEPIRKRKNNKKVKKSGKSKPNRKTRK